MAKPAYLEDNSAELVRVIKNGAIFLRKVGATAPTGPDWTPTPTDGFLGYYSTDGYTLTPEPGSTEEMEGHNGDILITETAPGNWKVGVSALEGNERVNSAYFDIDPDQIGEDGSFTVDKASAALEYDMVTVGLDQRDRLVIAHYPRVKISDREAVTFNRTTLMAMGMTFRTFKGPKTSPYHFKAWGFVIDEAEA